MLVAMHCLENTRTLRHGLRRWLIVGLGVAAIAALVSLASRDAASAVEPGRQPGLPFVACVPRTEFSCFNGPGTTNDYDWKFVGQSAIAGSKSAKQWARMPIGIVAATTPRVSTTDCGDVQCDITNTFFFSAFFVSPAGSSKNYGLSPLIKVRTVAFGVIPVEAVLQLQQRRDEHDLPIPLHLTVSDRQITQNASGDRVIELRPAMIDDEFALAVKALRVDGRDLAVRGCRTSPTSRLSVSSTPNELRSTPEGPSETQQLDPTDPEGGWFALNGATLTGDLDITPFEDCATSSGDDVSALLTSAIAGPDNPVSVRVGAACVNFDGISIPPAPGQDNFAKAGCAVTEAEGYVPPEGNPRIQRVPKQLEFPSTEP